MKTRLFKAYYMVLSVLLVTALIFGSVNAASGSKSDIISDEYTATPKLANEEEEEDFEQVKLKKFVTDNGDGTYKLTLESYVTGTVIWDPVATERPTDVVLVLDQSGSMQYDFNGNSTSDNTKRRQYALKQAVKQFIEDMSGEDNKRFEDGNHYVSIVKFAGGNNGTGVADWTPLDADGVKSLENAVDNLSTPSGGTSTYAGLNKAADMFKPANYTSKVGKKPNRQKAVILFTDGLPYDSDEFYVSSANDAISSALTLKKPVADGGYGATVFTVGIFQNANADDMFPTKKMYGKYNFDHYCTTGAVGEYWKADDSVDAAIYTAGNRFLNLVSSNYPTASTVGLKNNSGWNDYRYDITALPPARSDSDFYYTAENATQLINCFVGISEWIEHGGTTVKLTKKAVVRDIISDYFELPASTKVEDIKTYTAKCKGAVQKTDPSGAPMVDKKGNPVYDYIFDEKVATKGSTDFSDVEAVITTYQEPITEEKKEGDRRNVSVYGFDYSENYVAYDASVSMPHGYKLIVEFNIKPIDNFHGGNNVPTNNPESGIYRDMDSKNPIGPFEQPEVNIPIPVPDCELSLGGDIVIYNGNTFSVDDIFKLDPEMKLLDDYINRTVYANGVEVVDGIFKLDETITYGKNTVKVKYEPKYEGGGTSVGAVATGTEATNEEAFTIYVLDPILKVGLNDTTGYFGTDYTLGTGVTPTYGIEWKEPSKPSDPSYVPKVEADATTSIPTVVRPFGTSDDLSEEFEVKYTSTGFSGKLTKQDTVVDAEAYFKDGDRFTTKGKVEFSTTCDKGCTSPRTDGTYRVHSLTGSLTVINEGGDTSEPFVYKIMKGGKVYTTVTVMGGGSVTVSELPVGTYTVMPVDDWSWKYESSYKDGIFTATLTPTDPDGSITCIHEVNSTWFSYVTGVIANIFGKELNS